ncbi:patatin-like phospholipase family protein [Luteolibacter sp. GHJ8]|uniref:Patatin-like phospholipase family protein n=1 Tax=Luteolibacter rhizosphaerae TaxID=2989719 RepID=A0ABT3G8R4_9BACT|nr:patatin-like phospholipase family protein [Luteolibacter rhizosphaerae]MCW1916238.1 patatin-like phospholipase family protein [Luteolibacter rhizosphaerae]
MNLKLPSSSCLFSCALSVWVFAGCKHWPPQRVDVVSRVWQTETPDAVREDFEFPENTIPSIKAKLAKRNPEFGIAISGGGTRSGSAGLGQLRALDRNGLLSQAKYLSVVSGGGWVSIPYAFLPSKYSDRDFFADYIPPETLNWQKIVEGPGQRGNTIPFEKLMAGHGMDFTTALPIKSKEGYAQMVNRSFLPAYELGGHEHFFAFDAPSVAKYAARSRSKYSRKNPEGEHVSNGDFYYVEKSRPYLIVCGGIKERVRMPFRDMPVMPFEMTPCYTGVPSFYRGSLPFEESVGGGYVDSFGYTSTGPILRANDGKGNLEVSSRLGSWTWLLHPSTSPRFALSDMMAISSAAPTVLETVGAFSWSFPDYSHWPAGDPQKKHTGSYLHTDGGATDNLGVAALVSRDVTKIVAFVNTPHQYKTWEEDSDWSCMDDIARLFGESPTDGARNGEIAAIFSNQPRGGETPLMRIRRDLDRALAKGDPLASCQDVETIANPHWRIKGGSKVRIYWMLLGPQFQKGQMQSRWFASLHPSSKEKFLAWKFPKFPNFPTRKVALGMERVVLLSQFASWATETEAPGIRSKLGLR